MQKRSVILINFDINKEYSGQVFQILGLSRLAISLWESIYKYHGSWSGNVTINL